MRHAKANRELPDYPLADEGIQSLQTPKFIEQILRINPDIIYTSPTLRTMQTAEEVVKIMKLYRDKEVKIKTDDRLLSEESMDTIGVYKKLLKK